MDKGRPETPVRSSAGGNPVIGVDLDNTLALYDDVVHSLAVAKGLIQPHVEKQKKEVRDAVRALPGGEIEWQKLQGLMYGPGMAGAKLAGGAASFFQLCINLGVKTYIVSHRTRFPNYGEMSTDLHQAALSWMAENHFFDAHDWAFSKQDVFFEPTRNDKLERIRQLGCTHLVDDLEEVFLEDRFPEDVHKILYAPSPPTSSPPDVTIATTWAQIGELVFGHVPDPAG